MIKANLKFRFTTNFEKAIEVVNKINNIQKEE